MNHRAEPRSHFPPWLKRPADLRRRCTDSGTYQMTPDQRVEWEAEVRSLYDGMVRIVVTPARAKLIDFETTLPGAVEELARQRDERQRS